MFVARQNAVNLTRALQDSRAVGVATGVLMATHLVAESEAFMLLRSASEDGNREIADIARDVVGAGVLDEPGSPLSWSDDEAPPRRRPAPTPHSGWGRVGCKSENRKDG